jgi:hypothetical protein
VAEAGNFAVLSKTSVAPQGILINNKLSEIIQDLLT